jgi:hypothetical protein
MKVIAPFSINGTVLTSSTVPETDYAEWASGTAYTVGQKVIRLTTHKIYEALGSTTGEVPENTPTKWLDLGATNRWKMFDNKVGTRTVSTGSITVEIKAGEVVQSVALLECTAASATVTVTDAVDGVVYSQTKAFESTLFASNWWHYFFDPIQRRTSVIFSGFPSYRNATVSITISAGTGNPVECGVCLVGKYYEFADAVAMGANMSIQDYSRKEADDFGNYEIVERSFAKRGSWDILIDRARTDLFFNTLASLRARPALYIGGEMEDVTIIYGFPKDFGIVIEYPLHTQCSIELEGLI